MKAKAKFYMFGGWHEFTVDTDNYDYTDTHFSSWTVSEDGHVFEIDMLKDSGKIHREGSDKGGR